MGIAVAAEEKAGRLLRSFLEMESVSVCQNNSPPSSSTPFFGLSPSPLPLSPPPPLLSPLSLSLFHENVDDESDRRRRGKGHTFVRSSQLFSLATNDLFSLAHACSTHSLTCTQGRDTQSVGACESFSRCVCACLRNYIVPYLLRSFGANVSPLSPGRLRSSSL